eukprot:m.66210 g.66210  ORF g.66210 m.66210 type:complete len:365 (+) comp14044_c0_seq5:166-1260(+)
MPVDCLECSKSKLSQEFDSRPLECGHLHRVCCQCLLESGSESLDQAPIITCGHCRLEQSLPNWPERRSRYASLLASLEVQVNQLVTQQVINEAPTAYDVTALAATGHVVVKLLSGVEATIAFKGSMSTIEFMQAASVALQKEANKLRVYRQGEEIQHSDDVKLANYQLTDGDRLTAVALLVEVDVGVQHLRFDLQWDFPAAGEDYLDGSCFLYEKDSMLKVVDFQHRHSGIEARNERGQYAVTHTGDQVQGRGCQHGIEVRTSVIPPTATHLFFSLSAYNSPTIGVFPNPGVKIFEPLADGDVRNLGGYHIERAGDQQAVVMCAMYRGHLGWRVVEVEKFCTGNVREYDGILACCKRIVTEGLL